MSARLMEVLAKVKANTQKFKVFQNFVAAQEIVEMALAHTRYTTFYMFRTGVA